MSHTDLRIRGETAVVTAAGGGIGREIARQLSELPVSVVVNDIDGSALDETVAELSETNGSVHAITADVRNTNGMEELIAETVDRFGSLDMLINNVGVEGPTKPCEELTYEEFMRTLETNLGGHFNATRAAIPHLRASPDGRIVNISSMSGKRPLKNRTPYTTAKMGVIGFTRTLATELASDGVNVNAICPGSVAGPRLERVIEGQAHRQSRRYEDVASEFRNSSPMDSFVQASDIAQTVVYLCSSNTDRVTGQDINVTAGVCMY